MDGHDLVVLHCKIVPLLLKMCDLHEQPATQTPIDIYCGTRYTVSVLVVQMMKTVYQCIKGRRKYTHIHTHIYTHSHTLIHTHTKHTHTHTHNHTHTHTHNHTHTHIHTHTTLYLPSQVGVVVAAAEVGGHLHTYINIKLTHRAYHYVCGPHSPTRGRDNLRMIRDNCSRTLS